ncbi:hypothetical protein WJX74_008032 [Apatococcus lobatus]|uniref:Oxysterol-binding protein n=1 Tax=Apatococcus lobatus TaxID=904363 RepID=A0AAW1SAS8_9CHLO
MSRPDSGQAQGSVMDTLGSWGAGVWSYAASSLNSLMGYEELNVVNPESSEAQQGPTGKADKRQEEFTNYKDFIGMDITSLVSLPVWIMEPFTMLQKMAEIMEYNDRLDKALECDDPYVRLAWVVGFTMAPWGAVERAWKPFNPILGETFELELENGVRYLAEQVCHHPPIGAAHAEGNGWSYDIVSAPTTRFNGNSVDVFPLGRSRIRLKKTGEVFSLVPPPSKANNVIIGRVWIDTAGDYSLINTTTGAKCSMYFTPCGWFGSGRYEISGHIITETGKKVIALSGKWNSHLDMVKCDEEGDPIKDAETIRLWECAPKPAGDKYSLTYFARRLNVGKGLSPLASDSRRRPDRAALEGGDHGSAGQEKYALEEVQRAEKREREKKGETWAPRWFRKPADKTVLPNEYSEEEVPMWEFTGEGFNQPKPSAPSDGDCSGKGFFPWQYSDILQRLRPASSGSAS